MARTHQRTCTLCEAMCGIVVTVDDVDGQGEQVTSIRGDDADPFSKGHICPKAIALQDLHTDPDRLRWPVRRTDDGWEELGWDEALDLAASLLRGVQDEHGPDSVGVYLGNPNAHNLESQLFGSSLVRALRTRNRFSATSVDQLPHQFVQYHVLGHQLLFTIPDVDRTDFFLVLGANPLQSNGSLMSAGGISRRLRELRDRGGRLVVVDPRRTRTAEAADVHHAIRPGHDVLLLLAMVHVLFDEDLVDPGRLAAFTDGIDEVAEVVAPWSPERVADRLGWDPETIRGLAREFAAAESAIAYGRMGTSTQAFGAVTTWLLLVLNVLTGNLDRPGGMMFTTPAVDIVLPRRSGGPARWHSRVRGLPEFGGELPVAVLAEEMLTPGEGQVRGMLTIAGNPVLSTPNGGQLDEGFAGLEAHVAIDLYVNETTRHADVILPPTTGLEDEHYDLTFNVLAVRNVAKWSDPCFPVEDGRLHEADVLRGLARRLQADDDGSVGAADDPRATAPASAIVDRGLRHGPYDLTLEDLRERPEGIDLGPLEPRLPERLFTDDQRIRLAPEVLVGDLGRVEEWFTGPDEPDGDTLSLIGRRHLRDNNSWLHNAERLVRGKPRCTVMLHPDDADARDVSHGDDVCVRSRVGEVVLPVEVTDEVMVGVASIPHGYGHDRDGVDLSVAEQHAGVSINDLTDDRLVDALTGNAAFSGTPVTVTPA